MRITMLPAKFLSFGHMNLAQKDVSILQTQKDTGYIDTMAKS